MTSSPNRLVATLTPIVFAPLAGSIAVLAARYFPGVDVDEGSLTAIFVAGATIAFGKAALWLKGWQDWEKREAEGAGDDVDLPLAEDDAPAFAGDPGSGQDGSFDDESFLEEDPMLADDPTADGALDFDESDLGDALTAPLATDENGSSA
jgi:hypothetical protein